MTSRIIAVLVMATAGVLGTCETTLAQVGGSPGAFGNRSVGSTIPNRTSNFGGGGAFQGSGGTQRGAGGGRGGIGGNVAGATLSTPGFSIQRQQGEFIGADSNDVPSFMQNLQNTNFIRAQIENIRQNQGRNPNANRAQSSNQTLPRPDFQVAFEHNRVNSVSIEQMVRNRVEKTLNTKRRGAQIEAALTGETVVLRGTVLTEYDRLLAEELVALQPGIAKVENQLRVGPPLPPQPAPSQR